MFKQLLSLFSPQKGDLALIEAVSGAVTEWIAEPDMVLHEIISFGIHVDFHVVFPSETRPFITVVTSGMAQKAMRAPKGACTHAELVMFLPPDWPIDKVTEDKNAHWPIKILRTIADYPHSYKTFLSYGHTLPLGEEDPFGGHFMSALLYEPKLLEDSEMAIQMADGRAVFFFAIVLLREPELMFDVEHGLDELFSRVEQQGLLQDVLTFTPGRRSIDLSPSNSGA
jgi:hypothetical protein